MTIENQGLDLGSSEVRGQSDEGVSVLDSFAEEEEIPDSLRGRMITLDTPTAREMGLEIIEEGHVSTWPKALARRVANDLDQREEQGEISFWGVTYDGHVAYKPCKRVSKSLGVDN